MPKGPSKSGDFDPVYCLKCRSVLPPDIAETQTLCPACVEEERVKAAEWKESHPDTRVATCPKCGGRNVKTIMQRSEAVSFLRTLVRFYYLFSFWGWFLRNNDEADRYDEGKICFLCQDCSHVF